MVSGVAPGGPDKVSSPERIRNVVLVGPAGAGKTMLLERLIAARVPGRQMRGDPRSSQSLNAAFVSSGGLAVNLLDTPGNADFVGEVRAGLRAADAVLFVVPATDLIDDATRLLWRECEAIGMARAVAVTKLEHARADFDETVEHCRLTFGDAQPATLPVISDGSVTGEINLLRRTVLDYGSGEPIVRDATPEEAALLEERRNLLMESIIEESEDEDLLERHLSGEEVELSAVADDLRAAIATARFFPIIATHAPTGVGIEALYDLIEQGFPAPVAAPMPAVYTATGGSFGDLSCDPNGPLVAEVVRTTSDPFVGRLSLVRVFSGTLRSDEPLHVSGHLGRFAAHVNGHADHDSDDERVGPLSAPLSDDIRPKPFAIAGDLVLVSKLTAAETSDTLSSKSRPALVEPWLLPEPLLPVAVHASSRNEEEKLGSALQRLVAEDVTMRLEHNPETRQVVIWAMGPAHVEKLLGTLRDNWHVSVEVEPVRTSLRETFLRSTEAHGRLVKQSGGHGQYAVCKLEIEPLERGAGIEFTVRVVGGAVPRQFIPSVEKGVRTQLEKGLLAGYPVVDLRVTLVDGKAHSVDSSDMAFQTAGGLALREAAATTTVSMLEPYDAVTVIVPDDLVGGVMSDLSSRRGRLLGTDKVGDDRTLVNAEVPQTELTRYAIDLRSATHGAGTFTRSFAHYEPMPEDVARSIESREHH